MFFFLRFRKSPLLRTRSDRTAGSPWVSCDTAYTVLHLSISRDFADLNSESVALFFSFLASVKVNSIISVKSLVHSSHIGLLLGVLLSLLGQLLVRICSRIFRIFFYFIKSYAVVSITVNAFGVVEDVPLRVGIKIVG